MKDEQSNLIEALKFAVQMELDGKKYYTQIAKESSNKVGKELYPWLASQEELHRQRFEEIYKSMSVNKEWPNINITPQKGQKPITLFSKAIKDASTSLKAKKDEIDALQKAMDMEIKSRDFYKQWGEKSISAVQRKFFNSISAEEQGHYMVLVDYKEYLVDPTGWFTRTEHHLLDGA